MTQSYFFLIQESLSSSIMGNSNCTCVCKEEADQPPKRKTGSVIRKDSANDNASIASSDIKGAVTMPEQATTDEQDKPKTEEQTDADKSNTLVSSNHSSLQVPTEEETQ